MSKIIKNISLLKLPILKEALNAAPHCDGGTSRKDKSIHTLKDIIVHYFLYHNRVSELKCIKVTLKLLKL